MLPESKRESGDGSKGGDDSDRRRSAVVGSTGLGERKAETGMQRSQAQTLQRTGPVRARRLDHLGRPITTSTTTTTTTTTTTKTTTMAGAKKRDVSTTSTTSSTALSSRRSATKTAAASSAARRARATPTNAQNLSQTPRATAGNSEAAPSDRAPSSSAPVTERAAAAGAAGTGPAKTKPARKTITVASRFMSSTPKQSQPRLAQQTRQTLQPQSASARMRKAPSSARGPSTSASASSASARARARTPSTSTRTSTPLAARAGSTFASRPNSNQARLATQARPSSAHAKENSRSNAVSTPKTTSIKTAPANGPLGEALLALDDTYRLAFVRAELEASSDFGDEETALLEDWKRVQVLEQRLHEARLERDRLEDEAHVALQIKAFAGKDLTWLQYAVRDVGSALARSDSLVRVRTAEGEPALSDDLDPHTRTAMAVSLFPTASTASS